MQAPSLRDSGPILEADFPTLKRGANKHCAGGAGEYPGSIPLESQGQFGLPSVGCCSFVPLA